MNDQHEEAIAALTPLTKRKNGWDAASLLARTTMDHLEQDPSAHYQKAIELDSSHWYQILIRQRTQSEKIPESLASDTNETEEVLQSIQHIGLWPAPRRTHLESPTDNSSFSSQLASSLYSPSPQNKTFDWKAFTTPEPTVVVSSTNLWP